MENSLLTQVRQNTIQAKLRESSKKINDALTHLIDLIKSRSLQGLDHCSIELSILNVNRIEAECLMNYPQLNGFNCDIKHERISSDSPSGFYMADVLKVSWE